MIDYGRSYHENVNQLTVQHLKEHVKDPTYRDVIQNVVSAISTSCLGGADTFIERKGQLDTLLESVPEETPVQPVAAAVTMLTGKTITIDDVERRKRKKRLRLRPVICSCIIGAV